MKEKILEQLLKIQGFYEKEREYSRNSSWDSFAEAKGELRWIQRYVLKVMGVDFDSFSSMESLFQKLNDLVDRVNFDDDYPYPGRAKSRVRIILTDLAEQTKVQNKG